ncbi:MAG: aspartyl-phosphate phosphatase Spo0E family protein [Clostridiales bacterium]|nr:aspartyl-phosphate phosphatase Spo0E family protein [Clostridiales bacterium]
MENNLEERTELLRNILKKLLTSKLMTDREVIKVSKELDKVINEYYYDKIV